MERRTKIGIFTMIFIISFTIAVSLGMTLPKKSSVDQNDLIDIDFEEEIEAGNLTQVNSVNFDYAETIANYRDVYKKMRLFGKDVNSFMHLRNKAPAGDDFPIVRPNFDTLYSVGIMDTHMGPVEITLPDPDDRYMSIICFDDHHYHVYYSKAPAVFHLQSELTPSRYVMCIVRTIIIDDDYEIVHELQDQISVESEKAREEPENLDFPRFDPVSLGVHRRQMRRLFNQMPDSSKMFGTPHEAQDIPHMLGVAGGFGGLSENMATYLNFEVERNDGESEYVLSFRDVPVNAFWSITVYDEEGFFLEDVETIALNIYTAIPNADGSYTIHFSNDASKINNINIAKDWNYCVRMYEPQQVVIDGTWTFPNAEKVDQF